MYWLLNPRFLIGLALVGALTFTHFFVYRAGKNNVRTEWTASVAKANAEARSLEQRRQDRANEAAVLATKRERSIVADAARVRIAADRLRDTLDAVERASAESSDAASKSVAALRAVFDSCRAEYERMGREAAGHASDSLTYQQAWPK